MTFGKGKMVEKVKRLFIKIRGKRKMDRTERISTTVKLFCMLLPW